MFLHKDFNEQNNNTERLKKILPSVFFYVDFSSLIFNFVLVIISSCSFYEFL